MRAFFDVTQGECSVDHAEMGESLGKISQCVASFGSDLFREKIDIVRESESCLVNFVGFLESSAAREKIGFPKTAKGKCAFMPIFALLVAMH